MPIPIAVTICVATVIKAGSNPELSIHYFISSAFVASHCGLRPT
jgi:hypothetical protein